MQTKLIEIRDRATFIPALAICPGAPSPVEGMAASRGCTCDECGKRREREEAERWLWATTGYGRDAASQHAYVLLFPISPDTGVKGSGPDYDPYRWQNVRTMQTAHRWLTEHFDEVQSGDVVDVEFILGEVPAPKVSDRLRQPEPR